AARAARAEGLRRERGGIGGTRARRRDSGRIRRGVSRSAHAGHGRLRAGTSPGSAARRRTEAHCDLGQRLRVPPRHGDRCRMSRLPAQTFPRGAAVRDPRSGPRSRLAPRGAGTRARRCRNACGDRARSLARPGPARGRRRPARGARGPARRPPRGGPVPGGPRGAGRAVPHGGDPRPAARGARPMSPPGASILVVDDVPANLHLLLEALTREGYRVLVAESGESALDQLRFGWPDAVLLDYRLPGLDGIEVCRRMRALPGGAELPILFLTAVHELDEKVRALDAGAVDYVTKPIQAAEVLARLRTHLRIATLQRSLSRTITELEAAMAMRVEAEELLRESLDRALVVAGEGGRITFATREAQALLAHHFPAEPRDRLPRSLAEGEVLSELGVRRLSAVGSDPTVFELV